MHDTIRSRLVVGAALTAAAVLSIAHPAAAADPAMRQLTDEQRARIEARFEEIGERLELSDEQKAQLEPVLRKDFEKRAEVMRLHGATRESKERPGRGELRALRRDLEAIREKTDAEVERILDQRQLQEYRKIQQEARGEMRERMRSRRQESRD